MSVIQLGLLDKTGHLDDGLVQSAAAALNIQVTRDLPQFWPVQATVLYLAHPNKVPAGVWPVQLVNHLPPGEGGFHLDKHNQPYAQVLASAQNDGWTIAASHEVLEMLVDPYGNRLHSSRSIEIVGNRIKDGPGQFEYLVEACDPCEADTYGYSINGIAVSDFITPHFYDPVTAAGTRYSFTGAIKSPREILPGGYISWVDQQTEEWQQLQWVDSNEPPKIVDLGPANGRSLREWVDGITAETNMRTTTQIAKNPTNHQLLQSARERRVHLDRIAEARAKLYTR